MGFGERIAPHDGATGDRNPGSVPRRSPDHFDLEHHECVSAEPSDGQPAPVRREHGVLAAPEARDGVRHLGWRVDREWLDWLHR
jgi:hypothetical protein